MMNYKKLYRIYNSKTILKDYFHLIDTDYLNRVLSQQEISVLEKNFKSKKNSNEELCSICFTEFGLQNDEHIIQLPICQHKYHADCIVQWFQLGNKNCPYCRGNVKEKLIQHYHPQEFDDFIKFLHDKFRRGESHSVSNYEG